MKKLSSIPRPELFFILVSLVLGGSYLFYVITPLGSDGTFMYVFALFINALIVILSIFSLNRLFRYLHPKKKRPIPKKVTKVISKGSLADGYQQFLSEVRTVRMYLLYFYIIIYKYLLSSYNRFNRTVVHGKENKDVNSFIDNMTKDPKIKHISFVEIEKLDGLTIYSGISRVKMSQKNLRYIEEVYARGNNKQGVSANFDDGSCQSFKVVVSNEVS